MNSLNNEERGYLEELLRLATDGKHKYFHDCMDIIRFSL